MNYNRDYTSYVTKHGTRKAYTSDHNTICTYSGCHSNCHKHCNMSFTMDEYDIQERCWAFRKGRYTKCRECGHSYRYHQHEKALWEQYSWTETVVNEPRKREYTNAEYYYNYYDSQYNQASGALYSLRNNVSSSQGNVTRLGQSFNTLALSGSFSGHLASMLRLLQLRYEVMQKTGSSVQALSIMSANIEALKKHYSVLTDCRV
jgi:hypothetical protein